MERVDPRLLARPQDTEELQMVLVSPRSRVRPDGFVTMRCELSTHRGTSVIYRIYRVVPFTAPQSCTRVAALVSCTRRRYLPQYSM